MTYFKVDDGFWSHPKFFDMPDASIVLWVKAGSYASQHLTDGFVEHKTIRMIHCDPVAAVALVDAGLWYEVEDGYQFHDWHDHQRSSDAVKKERAAARERQRNYVARKRENDGVSDGSWGQNDRQNDGVSNGVTNVVDGKGTERNGKEQSLVLKNKNEKDFEEFWDVYPRRVAKQAARKAFNAALSNADARTIIAGAKRLRDDPNRLQEFTAHPATWLNQGRWDDDPLPTRTSNSRNAGVDNYHRDLLLKAARQDSMQQIEGSK